MRTPLVLRNFERLYLRPVLKKIAPKRPRHAPGASAQGVARLTPSAPDDAVRNVDDRLIRAFVRRDFKGRRDADGQGLRVLVLSAYPAVSPRHGGQIRVSSIIDAFQARDFCVRAASFFPAHAFYVDWPMGEADVAIPPQWLEDWRGEKLPASTDLISGDFVAARPEIVDAVDRYAGPTDVIFLEQPWMFPLVQVLKRKPNFRKARLVYGSQNIEYRLKETIYTQMNVANGGRALSAIRDLERRCAAEADLVVAVIEEDAAELRTWTAADVVLAKNGIRPWPQSKPLDKSWEEKIGGKRFALYAASGHRPNIEGFCEAFGVCLGALSPQQKIALVGGAAAEIVATPWFQRWKSVNERRVVNIGVLDEDDLSVLRNHAHVFLLPITSGGGSNLKTAEALYSGRHVVATPIAMRGYEEFSDMPGLMIAEPGAPFGRAVSRALEMTLPKRPAAARKQLQSLVWDWTLDELCNRLRSWQVGGNR